MKVFVYGTLKKGYGNHRLLADAKFIGEAYTLGFFDMINAGFPVLIPNPDGLVVKGEVYDIGDRKDILANLDALEGEGSMYDRREIVAKLGEENYEPCSIYIGNSQYWRGRGLDPRYVKDNYLEWSR